MKEKDVVQQFIALLDAALPAEVGVQTDGGDGATKPPVVVLRWRSDRLDGENGHTPFADYTRDSVTGDATGRELHAYFGFTADCVVRATDEAERDDLLALIDSTFLPYEYDSGLFHADTAEWSISGAEPRSNPVVEPDWYEGGKVIRFKYVKRATTTEDALGSTSTTINVE